MGSTLYALENIPSQLSNLQSIHNAEIESFLCFKLTLKCANLKVPPISDYQHFLHDKIKELHDGGMGYRRIAQWLNENNYLTPRGKTFKNSHVHSILKKRRLSNERFNKKYDPEMGHMSMKYIERK